MSITMPHVLLIEDEKAHAALIRRAFERFSIPMTLTIASSLKEARTIMAKKSLDLIIVDLNLPDGKGTELLPSNKDDTLYPVIVMTSYGDEQVAVETMKAGAVDYIVKSSISLSDMPRIAKTALRGWRHIVERRRAEQQIHRRNRELALLNRIIAASAVNTDPKIILKTACSELALGFNILQATAVLLNEDKTALEIVTQHVTTNQDVNDTNKSDNNNQTEAEKTHSIVLSQAPRLQHLFNQKAPLVVGPGQDAPYLASLQQLLQQPSLISLLLLPLLVKDEVMGWLSLDLFEVRYFSTEEISLAWSVAGQIAGALARAYLEQERRRLEVQYHQAQKVQVIGQLTAGIAHDFNNLLTVINGFTELVRKDLPSSDDNAEWLSIIADSGRRATDLVRQLLVFSHKQILEPCILNLNSVVLEVTKMLQRIISTDIELKTVLASDLWSIRSDPTQIEQIIVNLVVNGRDAMPNGGELIIETANTVFTTTDILPELDIKPGCYVMLSIADTGIGISDEIKKHIFEPFFTTKPIGKGTGLGLATVFDIVKQNKGGIEVDNRNNGGTIFKIYLPQVVEKAVLDDAEIETVIPRGSETILLVEDDATVCELARTVLERLGYKLLEARDGQSAWRLAEYHYDSIDLLLTDVIMPGMSGTVLAKLLIEQQPDLKVLFMSGYVDQTMIQSETTMVNVPFLQKPFSPAILARKVRTTLDS